MGCLVEAIKLASTDTSVKGKTQGGDGFSLIPQKVVEDPGKYSC